MSSAYKIFGIALTLTLLLPSLSMGQTTRPQYTDKEKKDRAEIAQRPAVIQEIDDAWQQARREDMEYAFRVNSAGTGADWRSNPEWLNVWAKFGRLYDNQILVNYVNSLGQRLVPATSPNRYTFRLLLDPTPRAEALSTGTIYVSTGLAAMMDSEAQLAYVLAHEIAHVEGNHEYSRLREAVIDRYHASKGPGMLNRMLPLAAAAGGGVAGGLVAGAGGAAVGAIAGALVGQAMSRNKFQPTEWDVVYENEADARALELMLDQSLDARLVPRMYARLNSLTTRDTRAGLGFIGDKVRVEQRTTHVQNLLNGALKPRIEKIQGGDGLIESTAGFQKLMAALKRDNGIIAMDYDLLPMAQENLEDAVKARSDDPRAQFYLGRLYSMTGRTAEESQKAVTAFQAAMTYDKDRRSYPDPRLAYALHLIAQPNADTQPVRDEIQRQLKEYVQVYQRQHAGALPDNMHVIYDYLLTTGDASWSSAPGMIIVTSPDATTSPTQTQPRASTPQAPPAPSRPATPVKR